ncbi:hypothetical protein GCM10027168_38370 [Streptomyces capparidis]
MVFRPGAARRGRGLRPPGAGAPGPGTGSNGRARPYVPRSAFSITSSPVTPSGSGSPRSGTRTNPWRR